MAAAVLSSDRLEVSVDGLTLSPNAEVPHCDPGPGEPAAGRSRTGPGSPSQGEAGGEAAEEAALSPERRWGFALEELYGLALRFFKGEAARRRGQQTPRRDRGGEAGAAASREPRIPRGSMWRARRRAGAVGRSWLAGMGFPWGGGRGGPVRLVCPQRGAGEAFPRVCTARPKNTEKNLKKSLLAACGEKLCRRR